MKSLLDFLRLMIQYNVTPNTLFTELCFSTKAFDKPSFLFYKVARLFLDAIK